MRDERRKRTALRSVRIGMPSLWLAQVGRYLTDERDHLIRLRCQLITVDCNRGDREMGPLGMLGGGHSVGVTTNAVLPEHAGLLHANELLLELGHEHFSEGCIHCVERHAE